MIGENEQSADRETDRQTDRQTDIDLLTIVVHWFGCLQMDTTKIAYSMIHVWQLIRFDSVFDFGQLI